MLIPKRTVKEIKALRDSLSINDPKWLLYNAELRFTAAYNSNSTSIDTVCWRHIYSSSLALFEAPKTVSPKWNILPLPDPLPGLDRITSAILINRNLDQSFIEAPLEEINPDMDGLDEAVELILRAVSKKVPVTIYGDYDADGITGTALLVESLSLIGAKTDFYINDRNKGYPMDEHGVKEIASRGTPRLIITVDNGASSHEAIKLARKMKMAVIVTDHHEMPEPPGANTIIHPGNFNTPLAGVGVAFKLVYKLYQKLGRNDAFNFLDLAAIGTVADVVPLTKENRIFAKHGILLINKSPRPAVSALSGKIDSEAIAFKIAPVINALSRMNGTASKAVDYLLEKDPRKTKAMAEYLLSLNEKRKRQVDSDLRSIEPSINHTDKIIIAKTNIHAGVAGLIAARLKEKHNRPVIVFWEKDDRLKGSCRSTDNFNVIEALRSLGDIVESCGGHPMAAGLTIKKSAFDTFRRTLLVRAANLRLSPPTYNIDAEIDTVDQDLIQKVNALEPFGKGFEPPLFLIKRDTTGGKKVGSNHLKIIDNGIEYVVWDAYENAKNKNIAIIGRPSLSDYSGGTQFIAKDYRLA